MLTNFHLPRTSLLLLVCAFAGKDLMLAAYRHAVEVALPLLFLRRLHADRVSAVVRLVAQGLILRVPVLKGMMVAEGGSIICSTRSSSFSCSGLASTNRSSSSKSAESSAS